MQTEMKTEVVLCPNCKEEVPKTLYCLNCGYPLYKMQTPAAKEEEKKAEVSEPETTEPVVAAEEKTEDTTIDDFSIDNVMDEVEDIDMKPEPVVTEPEPIVTEPEPIVAEPEPIYTAPVEPVTEPEVVEPEPVTIEVAPVVEDVTIYVEPEPVYVPEPEVEPAVPEPVAAEPEPVYEPEPAPVYQPVVIENTPTPIMEVKTEPEPLVVSPEPTYTAPVEPVSEPEPVVSEPEPVIEAAPVIDVAPEPIYTAPVEPVTEPEVVEPEPVVSDPEPVIEPEVVSTPEVTPELVVEPSNMIEYDPDPAIKELMGDFAKNLSMKIRLVDLLKSGEVKKETFHRLFESYLARGEHLMNSRNEMLERVKYELESKEKAYNETKIGLEELKIKRTIGDVSEGEYKAKSPGLEWDINKYENDVNQKNAEIAYLSDISKVLSSEEIDELNKKGNDCLEGLDQLAYSNILDPETAGRVKVSLEEAIACLKS